MGVRQTVRGDLTQARSVGVLHEQGAALVTGAGIGSRLGPHEDELASIRRVVTGDVAPAKLAFWRVGADGEPGEAASVGGADGIDTVDRGVAPAPDDLAEEPGAVGRPGSSWCSWDPSGFAIKTWDSSIAGSYRVNTIWPFGPGTFAWAAPATAARPSRAIPTLVTKMIKRLMTASPRCDLPGDSVTAESTPPAKLRSRSRNQCVKRRTGRDRDLGSGSAPRWLTTKPDHNLNLCPGALPSRNFSQL